MSLNPQVTVVMTAYRDLQYLTAAIDSVLDQDISSLELILVDDGSTADLVSIIAPYRGRLRYIRQENQGPGAARDTGLRAASSEFVAFCDSDDLQLSFRISAHLALLQAHPQAALVFSDLAAYEDGRVTVKSVLRDRLLGLDQTEFDEAIQKAFGLPSSCAELGVEVPAALANRPVYCARVPALIASRHVAWGGALMLRKSMIEAIGGHDPELRYLEDWSFVSKISKLHELVFWDVPVVRYRQHTGQLTKRDDASAFESYRNVVVRVWKDDEELKACHAELHKRLVVRAYLKNIHYAIQAGELKRARADISACLRTDRFNSVCYRQLLRCRFLEIRERLSHWSRAAFGPVRRISARPALGLAAALAVISLGAGVLITSSQPRDAISLAGQQPIAESVVGSPNIVANRIVEPMFAAWTAGDLQESLDLGRQVASQLSQYPADVRQLVVRHLVNFSVSLGRIDDALEISNKVSDVDEKNELQARIYFASGERNLSADLLSSGSTFRASGTALLMALLGIDGATATLVATTGVSDQLTARQTVIEAVAAMQAGNGDTAKRLFRAATESLEITDGGFYFVALDMLAVAVKSEGDAEGAIRLLENTMPQRDLSARNGSAIFWLMCQRNLAALYRSSGREEDAVELENILRARLQLADASFPLAKSLAGV